MAYSKNQYETDQIPEYKAIELEIDNQLKSKGHATYKIVSSNSTVKTKLIIKFIKKTYEAAGWTVHRENGYDQRNSDSWDYLSVF